MTAQRRSTTGRQQLLLQQRRHHQQQQQATNNRRHIATTAGSDGTTPKAQAQADISSPSGTGRVSWPKFLGSLFASGAIAGTVLDGIHSKEMLQVGAKEGLWKAVHGELQGY